MGTGGFWEFVQDTYCLSDPSEASRPVVRALDEEGKLPTEPKCCGWAKKKPGCLMQSQLLGLRKHIPLFPLTLQEFCL